MMLGGGFAIFVIWDQWYWWRRSSEHFFGFLVPLFAAFVIWHRWPRIKNICGASGLPVVQDGTGRASVPGGRQSRRDWQGLLLTASSGAVFLGGAVVFAAGAVFRAHAGPTVPSSVLIAAGFACLTLSMVYLNGAGNSPGGPGLWRHRLTLAALFIFPSLIWLLSVPVPGFLQSAVSLALLDVVAASVLAIFDFLALPVERAGNVLLLPGGRIGVAEACSGIRSLTGCLFAGSFLAAVFLESCSSKVLLVFTSAVCALGLNILRSAFLTGWAFHYGPDALTPSVHDLTSFGVFGLTCLALIAVLAVFRRLGNNMSSEINSRNGCPAGGEFREVPRR